MRESSKNDSRNQDNGELHFGEMTTKVSFIFITNLLSGILGYIIIFIANRFIGSEEYGIVIFSWSFAGFFSFISDLGFAKAHIKRLSEGQDEAVLVPVYAIIKLMLTGIMAASVFLALWIWEILGGGYESELIKDIIVIVLSYYILTSIGSIFVHTYTARRDAIRTQFSPLFEVLSRCIAVLAVASFALGAMGLATTWFIAGAAYFSVAIYSFRGNKLYFPNRKVFFDVSRSYWKFALPLSLSIIIAGASQFLDKILIQIFLSSEDVAIFFVPQRLMMIIAIGPALSLMLLPLLSEINSKRGKRYVSQVASQAMFYISLFIFPIGLFLFAFARPVLSIFVSSDFIAAETVFRILIIASILQVLAIPFSNLLLGSDKSRIYARIRILFSFIVISLDLILIPPRDALPFSLGMGIEGAGISLLIAYSFLFVMTFWEVKRYVVFKIPKSILSIAFLSALSSAGVVYIYSYLGATRFYEILGYFGFYLLILVSLIILAKILTWQEFKRLVSIFKPSNFIKFIKI